MLRIPIIAFIIISVLSPAFAYPEEARIKNTLITNNKKELLVYFYVEGCFTPNIEEAIHSGIATTFVYKVYLYKKTGDTLGKKLASGNILHTIKYDPLKKDYTVTMSEKKEPFITQDFKAAKNKMAKVEAFPVITLDQLIKDSLYSIQIKAEMDTIKLPPVLNYLFFFLSYWDFETPREKVEFAY